MNTIIIKNNKNRIIFHQIDVDSNPYLKSSININKMRGQNTDNINKVASFNSIEKPEINIDTQDGNNQIKRVLNAI